MRRDGSGRMCLSLAEESELWTTALAPAVQGAQAGRGEAPRYDSWSSPTLHLRGGEEEGVVLGSTLSAATTGPKRSPSTALLTPQSAPPETNHCKRLTLCLLPSEHKQKSTEGPGPGDSCTPLVHSKGSVLLEKKYSSLPQRGDLSHEMRGLEAVGFAPASYAPLRFCALSPLCLVRK